jgi:hypothetical protein
LNFSDFHLILAFFGTPLDPGIFLRGEDNRYSSIIHKPQHAVLQQMKKTPSEIYVAYCVPGSPANQNGMAYLRLTS